MAGFTKYPYIDYSNMNLDWVISKVKDVETAEENASDSASAAANSANAAANSASAAANSANAAGNSANTAANSADLVSGYAGQIADNTAGIEELNSRITELATLSEGSTTGDAELIDIRTEVTGAVASNAGNAVRDQVRMVGGNSYNMLNNETVENGWYGATGTIGQTSVGDYKLTPYYSIRANASYIIQADNPSYLGMQFVWFDSLQNFIRRDNFYSGNYATTFAQAFAPEDAAYMRCGFYYSPGQVLTPAIMESFHTMITQSELKRPYVKFFGGVDLSARRITDYYNAPFTTPLVQHKITASEYVQGNLNVGLGSLDPYSTTRVTTGFVACSDFTAIEVYTKEDIQHRLAYYDAQRNFIATSDEGTWHYRNLNYPKPANAAYFRISVRYATNTTITPANAPYCVYRANVSYRLPERSKLTNKVCSILGDSLSTYAGIDNYVRQGVPSISDGQFTVSGMRCRYPTYNVIESAADMYWAKLMTFYGMSLGVNYSQIGATITAGDNSISDPVRIKGIGSPDFIIINGGTNDITNNVPIGTFDESSPKDYTDAQIDAMDRSTFYNALKALLSGVQHYYPNAKVLYVMPNFAASNYTPERADRYIEAIKVVCDWFGVPTVDARQAGVNLFNIGQYMNDGLHYNSAGMQMLFEACKRACERYFK